MCGSPSGGCGSPSLDSGSSSRKATSSEIDNMIDQMITDHRQMIVKLTKIRSSIKASNQAEVKKALADLLAKMA